MHQLLMPATDVDQFATPGFREAEPLTLGNLWHDRSRGHRSQGAPVMAADYDNSSGVIRSTMSFPIFNEAVAAGEGALPTWTIRDDF